MKTGFYEINMLSWEDVEQETVTLTDVETATWDLASYSNTLSALNTTSEAGTGSTWCVAHWIRLDSV